MNKIILIISILATYNIALTVAQDDSSKRTDQIFKNEATSQPELKISVFPNPVTDNMITIISEAGFYNIEILSIVGKSVFNKEYEGENKVILQLDEIEKGIYIVKVRLSKTKTHTEKLLVK